MLAAALALTSAGAQAQLRVPVTWTPRAVLPPIDTDLRGCVGTSFDAWEVAHADGQISAQLEKKATARVRDQLPYDIDLTTVLADLGPPRPGDPRDAQAREWHLRYARDYAGRRVLTVENGWFVAYDAGEFGGSLWWFPRIPGPGRLLQRGPFEWLEREGQDVLAIGGLAHDGSSDGVVLRLGVGSEGRWDIRQQLRLRHAPSALIRDDRGRLVIATWSSVERLGPQGLEVLVATEFPDGPFSLVVAEDEFVIGFRVFVLVLRPSARGYQTEWYVPPQCSRFVYRGVQCVCVGSP
jgi:hypothetical protein